jgi:nucleotide-binding universal stress UspA family protein
MEKILCATRGGEGSERMQDQAIALAKEQNAELIFFFVADISFLAQMAAPIVIDVERRLEQMGQFQLARVQKRAAAQGIEAQAVVRCGRFRLELVAAAQDLGATLILLGRPHGQTAVFEEETLSAFAAALQNETGIKVRVL